MSKTKKRARPSSSVTSKPPTKPSKAAPLMEEAPRKGRKRQAIAATLVVLITIASMMITIVSPFIGR